MDIFDKIRDDTIVLLHEYYTRQSYFILEIYLILFVLLTKKSILKLKLAKINETR
jgi:hypothetical protein